MKKATCSVFWRMAVVACGVSAAYVAGFLEGAIEGRASAPNDARAQNTGRVGDGALTRHALTRDEAMQWLRANWPATTTAEKLHEFSSMLTLLDDADLAYLTEMVGKLPPGRDRDDALQVLFTRLSGRDPVTALSLVRTIPDLPRSNEITYDIFRFLGVHHSIMAMDELAKLPRGPQIQRYYNAMFAAWAGANATNSPDAAAAATSLPPGAERTAALLGVAKGWSTRDPQAALDWADGLWASDPAVFKEILSRAGAVKPELAAQYMEKITSVADRNEVIDAIAKEMGRSNPHGALDWLNEMAVGETYDTGLKGIFSQLNVKSPAVVELLANLPDQSARNTAILALTKGKNENLVSSAIAWLQSLPETDAAVRIVALNSVIADWSRRDPAAALAFVQNSSEPLAYLNAAPAIAQNLSQSSPQEALNWVQSLPDGGVKDQALSNVLANVAKTDFPAAWAQANTLPAGSGRDGIMNNLLGVLAKRDATKAANLINQFSTVETQQAAARTVASTWGKQDQQMASQWIDSLPAGPVRDAASAQFVAVVADKDATDALIWAKSIRDETTRFNSIETVLISMAKKDSQSAMQALQTIDLPTVQRVDLLQTINSAE